MFIITNGSIFNREHIDRFYTFLIYSNCRIFSNLWNPMFAFLLYERRISSIWIGGWFKKTYRHLSTYRSRRPSWRTLYYHTGLYFRNRIMHNDDRRFQHTYKGERFLKPDSTLFFLHNIDRLSCLRVSDVGTKRSIKDRWPTIEVKR